MSYQQQQPYQQQQQYQAGPTMQASQGGNRNAKNMPEDGDGRDWSSGICSCADGGACCVSFFCPCITYGKVKHRYEHLHEKGYPDPEHGGGCCSGACWGHCLLTSCFGMGWVLQIFNRTDIRKRYNIKGSGCGDCCMSFWCNPCALSQQSHELELEEQSFQGFKA
ncbi:PLAC8 family-domain-containing protein [Pterulicium gracile]|uniref:PLAC8 family-domain-containing protein n=1 Tax=Pterulicium gracile TaxID=1884261 RepID=A0A5C3QLE8_9AGAR|nr:PLAC8 family-domain-containing protein [Pterula gracilis]